jgi:cobyrinic acid a,c-diamide synthase
MSSPPLRGGSGKTIFSVGIIAALRAWADLEVAPFKKGPDYIDAGWLALAAGRPCYNLDTFLIDPDTILGLLTLPITPVPRTLPSSKAIAVFTTASTPRETSTAELAKLLDLPVILMAAVVCIDASTKTTRIEYHHGGKSVRVRFRGSTASNRPQPK